MLSARRTSNTDSDGMPAAGSPSSIGYRLSDDLESLEHDDARIANSEVVTQFFLHLCG
jgi:hypothetical protein